MKHALPLLAATIALTSICACSNSSGSGIELSFQGDSLAVIKATKPAKYLLLPIQESSSQAEVLLSTGSADDTWMDVRLATDEVQYYVPFELKEGAQVLIRKQPSQDAVCWANISTSDEFDTTNIEEYRPVYHHTPLYGWMNDANGLVYKDGEWHLYFQYNPYGSVWGNMHWGHSVSRDLVHWEHLAPAIARDNIGHIFSGSTVVDKNNTAGFGEGAIIAYYTSHNEAKDNIHVEMQSMAYSTDNGRTFTKYEGNPVLWSNKGLENDPKRSAGLRDFRDPKLFWYEPLSSWYMIVSSDKEMRFYTSKDLKDWSFVSAFGEGYGFAPNQFECPDFFPLTVQTPSGPVEKWVMIVNINPGCLFGGSATEYFVGSFDGREFKCESAPETYKFIDFGKDHYATVTFSNAPDSRVIGVPWMSNWEYANTVPTRQYRSANALPREFSLFQVGGETYMAATPVAEVKKLVSASKTEAGFVLEGEKKIEKLSESNSSAYRLEFDIIPATGAQNVDFDLVNPDGERAKFILDLKGGRFIFDRTEAGKHEIVCSLNERETDDHRKTISYNYKDDWALGTWAPLSLCKGDGSYHIDIFVDKCSVEAFVDGGRIAMTNLVFPSSAFNALEFKAAGDNAIVSDITISELLK